MFVYGLPPLKIDYRMDFYKARKEMLRMSKKHAEFGDREFLVLKGENKVLGYTRIPDLLKDYLHSKKVFYVKQITIPWVKTAYESSLTMKKILDVTSKRRSLFVIRDGAEKGRFQNYKLDDFRGEIIARIASLMFEDKPVDLPNLLKFPVKE
jgi:hypothetical protein